MALRVAPLFAQGYLAGPVSQGQPQGFCVWNGRAYFAANDSTHGWELWSTDGTEAGTHMVVDAMPSGEGWSSPLHLFAASYGVYYAATTATTGNELWFTDGTASGTHLVKDILPGSGVHRSTG